MQARHDKRVEFYRQFIDNDALVFDVGANFGNRTVAFLELGARVIAVEPQIYCVNNIKKICGSNPKLTIVPKALGSVEGIGVMHISNSSTLSSLSETVLNKS